MELIIESEAFDPDSHFLFWKPGSPPYVEPDGMALRLDKSTDLVLNTHFQPSGKPELIQPTLGLYFTDKPATMHPILLQLDNDRMLDIPPGEKNFLVSDDFTLPVDASVLAIYPHAHYLGKDMLAIATLPDGTKKTLIHIGELEFELAGGLSLCSSPWTCQRERRSRCASRTTTRRTTFGIPISRRSASWRATAPATRWRICGCRCCQRNRPTDGRSARGDSGSAGSAPHSK